LVTGTQRHLFKVKREYDEKFIKLRLNIKKYFLAFSGAFQKIESNVRVNIVGNNQFIYYGTIGIMVGKKVEEGEPPVGHLPIQTLSPP